MDRKVLISLMPLLFLFFVTETNAWSGHICSRLAVRWENRQYCVSRYWWGCSVWRDNWIPIYYKENYCCPGWSHNGTEDCTIPIPTDSDNRTLDQDSQLKTRQSFPKSIQRDDKNVCTRLVVSFENIRYCKQRHWWDCTVWGSISVPVNYTKKFCCPGWSSNGTEDCTLRETPDSESRSLDLDSRMNQRQRFPKLKQHDDKWSIMRAIWNSDPKNLPAIAELRDEMGLTKET